MKPLKFIFLGLFFLAAGDLLAQNIYIYPEQPLEFGNFTVANGGGTVTITDSGERSSSGTVQLLNSIYHPAIFQISTDSTTPLEVFVEVSREALVNADGTAMVMASVSPNGKIYTIQVGQPVKVKIGGTIQMNTGDYSPGAFHGNISITVIPNSE